MAFKTSDNGVNFLKSQEGCRLTAYKLSGETYYTIGYGHYGPDVYEGMTITEQEAENLLRQDLVRFENSVNNVAVSKFPSINQNQFDALVSYTYNRGAGGLNQLISNSNSLSEVSENIVVYWGSAETYKEALIKRRKREQALFNTTINIWLRTSRAESGNRFYNNASGGGISNCTNGLPKVSGYNVLCNCVGLAWGCFYETWYHNDKAGYEAVGGFNSRVRGDGGTIVRGCKSSNVFKDYVIDNPAEIPPKGGLIVWGGTANHVAYISDVSEDGNTITIQQSAYGGASWTNSSINGISGAWQTRTITRNNKGTNLWWYQNSGYSGASCEGFIKNPGVVKVSEPSEPDTPYEPTDPYVPPTKKRKGYNFLLFTRNRRM
jgi:GH24 family phage-related lysozyme (muramidase)